MAADYCQNIVNIAPAHNHLDAAREVGLTSPVPATGTNLAAFLGARLAASFGVLGCAKFGLTDPVSATVNGGGVATAVTYNVAEQKAVIQAAAGGTATPAASPTAQPGSGLPWFGAPPRRHRHHQNGAGM